MDSHLFLLFLFTFNISVLLASTSVKSNEGFRIKQATNKTELLKDLKIGPKDVTNLVTIKPCETVEIDVLIPNTGLDNICKPWWIEQVKKGKLCPDVHLLLYNDNYDDINMMNIPENPGMIVYIGDSIDDQESDYYYREKLRNNINIKSFYDLNISRSNDLNYNWKLDILRVLGDFVVSDFKKPEEFITRGFKYNAKQFNNKQRYKSMIFPQILCLLQKDNRWYLGPIWHNQYDDDDKFEKRVKDCIVKESYLINPLYEISQGHKEDILPQDYLFNVIKT